MSSELAFTSPVAVLSLSEDILILTVNAPPVNALGRDVRRAILDAVTIANGALHSKALIIRCGGKTFFAAVDIREFGKPPQPPSLPETISAVENARVPVVAAIHGSALGGGLEVALACHFRVAALNARLGLPEVKLGILPGAGGTQRLPRLIGIERALDAMTSGTPLEAAEALTEGLLDAIVPEGELLNTAMAVACEAVAGSRAKIRTRDRQEKYGLTAENHDFFENFLSKNEKRFRHLFAPKAIVDAVRFGLDASFEDAIRHERSLFLELQAGPQAQALRHVFFAEREAAKVPGLPGNTKAQAVAEIGVVGAGTMGTGIATNFLLVGMPVTLVEANEQALMRGRTTIARTIARSVESQRISAAAGDAALSCLRTSLDYKHLATADLIIEAAYETMAIKREIFSILDHIAKPEAILATNTSYLDVDQIAVVTSRPERVLGMHFFSPANVMKLLEIVKAEKTADEVLATALAVSQKINKIAVVAGVTYGFIGNRMLAVRRTIAEELILQGATPASIDRVIEDFGMPMGPFRMADLAGLDLGWTREASRSSTIRERLCELDRRGQKTRAGFYDYGIDGKATASAAVEHLIKDFAHTHKVPQRTFSDQELLVRLTYPMINEGAKILDEGKAYRASDIDVVWVNGYGWPAWRGGPMFYADVIGLKKIQRELDLLAPALGERHMPAALLRKLVAESSSFVEFDELNRSAGQQVPEALV
jgi:3-hydroxyacyl-CoA dehydrogenase